MKIIPLKQQSYLVSVDEFDTYAISFPLDKTIKFSKHLKTVLDDIPTLDEQLLTVIEDKHPRNFDSIKRLLQKLGKNFVDISSFFYLLSLIVLFFFYRNKRSIEYS